MYIYQCHIGCYQKNCKINFTIQGTDKISKLDDNEKFSVEFKNGGAILHIKEAEVAYMGDVICKAHNEYSHQDTTFFLNVLGGHFSFLIYIIQ